MVGGDRGVVGAVVVVQPWGVGAALSQLKFVRASLARSPMRKATRELSPPYFSTRRATRQTADYDTDALRPLKTGR